MAVNALETKAHELLGHLGPGKLAAVVQLLEAMVYDEDEPSPEKTAAASTRGRPGLRNVAAKASRWKMC